MRVETSGEGSFGAPGLKILNIGRIVDHGLHVVPGVAAFHDHRVIPLGGVHHRGEVKMFPAPSDWSNKLFRRSRPRVIHRLPGLGVNGAALAQSATPRVRSNRDARRVAIPQDDCACVDFRLVSRPPAEAAFIESMSFMVPFGFGFRVLD